MAESFQARILRHVSNAPASLRELAAVLDVDDSDLRLTIGIMLRAGTLQKIKHPTGNSTYAPPGMQLDRGAA